MDIDLIKIANKEFQLPGGINNKNHGISHWERVKELGRYLALHTGADTKVTDYFAYFHDMKRENEGDDPEHGLRATNLLHKLQREGGLLDLSQGQWRQLITACTFHSLTGNKIEDVTLGTCLDADRLDLWRLGIKPDPFFLNTAKAKEPDTIEFARMLFRNSQ